MSSINVQFMDMIVRDLPRCIGAPYDSSFKYSRRRIPRR